MTLPLRTVVQALEDAAASSRTGYRFMEEGNTAEPFFTFSGIERATAKFGAAMQALGLRQGDRIALILPDNQDFVFAFLGALRAGIVPVPIYPPAGLRQLTGYLDSTLHILTKSGAKMVLTDSDIKRLLGTLQRRASTLRAIVAVESIRRSREKLRPVKITPEDTCFLQFTSGSTSLPKGVVVSHRNVAANVRAFMQIGLGIHDGVDSGVSWLPLYHDMGLIGFVLAPLFHRNTVTFLPPLLFLKRPVRWLEAISRHRGSISFGPNFAYALCVKRIRDSQLSGLDLSSWRVAGCGAEPIRAANLRAFAQKFEPVGFDPCALLPCYGMAEATLAISFIRLGDGLVSDIVDADAIGTRAVAAPASDTTANPVEVVNCGKAFVDHQLAVFAADDSDSSHPLADRQVGELRLRGPSVTSGYFNEPELTKRAFAGEWMRTGDIGYQVDGDVYICGRSKDLIIINGRNYHPQDLEWAASHIEGVRKGSVLAFGTRRPLKDRERVVVAFETAIREEGAREALKTQVRAAVRDASGLTIDDVVCLDAGVLPKTSSGKLRRAETRRLYENGHLFTRPSAREGAPLSTAKEIAKSQLSYVTYRLFGK